MHRRNSDFLTTVCLILLLTLYYAAGWMVAGAPSARPFLSGLLAALTLLACGLLLALVHHRTMTGPSVTTAFLYLALAAAHPGALHFSTFHAATLLTAVSLTCFLLFNAVRPSLEYAIGMWASLAVAGMFLPPLLWLAPVLALLSAGRPGDKGKFWFATLLALVLPACLWIGVRYLWGDPLTFSDLFKDIWTGMAAIRRPAFHFPAATICRILMTAAATLTAVIHVFLRLSTFKTTQYHACMQLVLLTLCISVLALLFLPASVPAGMLVCLPVAPLLGEYVQHPGNLKAARLLMAVLGLLLLIERVSFFV